MLWYGSDGGLRIMNYSYLGLGMTAMAPTQEKCQTHRVFALRTNPLLYMHISRALVRRERSSASVPRRARFFPPLAIHWASKSKQLDGITLVTTTSIPQPAVVSVPSKHYMFLTEYSNTAFEQHIWQLRCMHYRLCVFQILPFRIFFYSKK